MKHFTVDVIIYMSETRENCWLESVPDYLVAYDILSWYHELKSKLTYSESFTPFLEKKSWFGVPHAPKYETTLMIHKKPASP